MAAVRHLRAYSIMTEIYLTLSDIQHCIIKYQVSPILCFLQINAMES